jgi:hypothetical protein
LIEGRYRRPAVTCLARDPYERPELLRIHLTWRDLQSIAIPAPLHASTRQRRQVAAQSGDQGLNTRLRRARRILPPDRIDEVADRNHLTGLKR